MDIAICSDLVRKYLGRVVLSGDNYFAGLNSTVFSDGSFCYIPKDTKCPMQISTYFRINALETGPFERTLIVADDICFVEYLEGCTTPSYDRNQLHAAVVELYCSEDAEIKYSTVQNWYAGDEDGNGGIYNFVTKRGLCAGAHSNISWTQVETGSAITWKYPSVVLDGDATVEAIKSKAQNARNSSQCNSMLIGDKAAANTYPHIQIVNLSIGAFIALIFSAMAENTHMRDLQQRLDTLEQQFRAAELVHEQQYQGLQESNT
ncbi:UPF0051 protein ABCI8, chloroplastic-like [Gastrolobium bilobum]|uniref:UPF0051 protein ABCI8, chloroplastic-like n=1 Tax=Gastrolobium bilobum TaxID=150636 RepID=UPI002AB02785|nr:UPF0051 protein ABCI8, chloroplastic-like [Gastrolobium bilobum]